MSFVGIDDTDSPRGGCTTFVLTEVLRAARRLGLDLLGDPALVRLDPNVPFRTRGNGALAARFGHGRGGGRVVGRLPEGAVRSFRRGRPPTAAETLDLVEAAWTAVRQNSRRGEPGTDPALVVVPRRPPAALYWSAVQRRIARAPVERLLRSLGAEVRTERSRRSGIVGAAAAVAWPGRHPTFELLAYRSPPRWGRPRRIDPTAVPRLEREYPELFLCRDPATRRLLLAPHTPCPILFGLRAGRPDRLVAAARRLPAGEPWERWLLFRTNQGTGDHLVRATVAGMRPFAAGAIGGTVDSVPELLRGGHVRFWLRDRPGDRIACLAFEPTKTLPRLARLLWPGDRLLAWGGCGADPVLRLEGIRLIRTVPRLRAGPNPLCPRCGRRTKSLGAGRGFRCPGDHLRLPPESRGAVASAPPPAPGWYHPTPSARRHLAPRPAGPGGDPVRWWLRRPRTDLYG